LSLFLDVSLGHGIQPGADRKAPVSLIPLAGGRILISLWDLALSKVWPVPVRWQQAVAQR
jgi:hypothetical protein